MRSFVKLLNFDFCASLGELLADCVSVILGNAFLNSLRSVVNNFLSFLQAQASDLTDNLNDSDLVAASALQHDVKLGLLFSSRSSASNRSSSNSNRSSSGSAELLFESLNELGELQNGECLNIFNQLNNFIRHDNTSTIFYS